MIATCATCPHFARDGEQNKGSCRKNPPTAGMAPSQLGQPVLMSFWPPVMESHWCGEHPSRAARSVLEAVN